MFFEPVGAEIDHDEAIGIGTNIWVDCWRGGAHLMLGDFRKALADLDQAIDTDPQDLEAHLWRGEAYRLMGRHPEAVRDLDRAIALDIRYGWGYVNRALLRFALGDEQGMAADFAMIPRDVIAAARGVDAAEPGEVPAPEAMRRILESALARAKGIRRPEDYLNRIWMGRKRRLPSKVHE